MAWKIFQFGLILYCVIHTAMQRKGIISDLEYGDKKRIASTLSCAPVTVESVLAGRRSATSPLGRKIVKAAELLIQHRQEVSAKLKEMSV